MQAGSEAASSSVHPLLRQRFSPTAFDERHEIARKDALLLVEAARWAPSAGNSQPWMFRPVLRGSRDHDLLLPLLAGSSRGWAARAGLLVINIRARFVAGSEIEYSEFSDYDLGQAVAHMTFQALSLGLACRQFRAFDHAAVTRAFGVAEDWDVRTITAVGKPAQQTPPARRRRSLRDVTMDAAPSPGPP
jgi:nitroreductase